MWDRKLYKFNKQTQTWEPLEEPAPLKVGRRSDKGYAGRPLQLEMETALDRATAEHPPEAKPDRPSELPKEPRPTLSGKRRPSHITGLTGARTDETTAELELREFEPEPKPGFFDRVRKLEGSWVFAVAGISAGVLVVLVVLVWMHGIRGAFGIFRPAPPPAEQDDPTDMSIEKQTDRYIKILGSISTRKGGTPAAAEADSTLSEYDQCLKMCEDDYGCKKNDDCEKALLVNCRKQCMGKYSKRFKKIRQQYYDDE